MLYGVTYGNMKMIMKGLFQRNNNSNEGQINVNSKGNNNNYFNNTMNSMNYVSPRNELQV